MPDPITAAVAVGWGLQAVGWIASPIISEIFKKGSSFLGFDASKKLKELEPKVLLLERVMEAVEDSPDRPRLEQLFKDLKSAFYEAEDILDDVEYHRLEKQIQDGKLKSDGDSAIRWVKKKLHSAMPSPPLKDQESGMSKSQLKSNFEKIEKVINDACEILERLNLPPVTDYNWRQLVAANSRSAVTTAAPPLKVIGRDEDRDKIIAMLHDKGCDGHESTNIGVCYSVIGIHGIAGSGKSTLAQYICDHEKNDKEENDGHFDLVIWIHVSQKFDLQAIFTEVLEGATGKPSSEFKNRSTLRENLVKELRGKRILLVLDDVWYNIRDAGHQGELEQVLSLLEVAKTGTKILVTSRSKDALVALGAVGERCIPISDLNDDVFLQMFMHYALRGAVVPGHDGIKLQMLGDEIAKKLNRSPLAARTVGAQLCLRPNVEFWRRTRDRDLLNETMGALWWSYQHLDEQVRRCFAYCSIYPRRRHLKRDELVQLWMAEGFIKTTNAEEELDGVGQDYFDELLSASFLQLGERRMEHGCEVDYFTVHDLLRDLAEEAAIGDCFKIEEGFRGEVPPDVRHIFVGSCDRKMLTEKIFELQNLRTLIMDYPLQIELSDEKFLESMFTRLQNLRVLVLRFNGLLGGRIFSLPASIGLLKHLRYFYFDTDVEMKLILPDSITKLYHIQLLYVFGARGMDFSGAKHMSHLINLRRVSSGLDFPNIGRLKWLQILDGFTVKNKLGYEIRQLKQLNMLKGELAIMVLQNVRCKEEAIEASVAQKERVTELVFIWDDRSCSPEVEAEVLEGLCPSKYLERLQIRNYKGSTYPNWMVSKHNGGPEHLRNLWFYNCSRLEPAPELFEVFVHLRWFRLWHSNWDALPDNMEQLTSLLLLDISYCPNIRLLPALPQTIEKFYLEDCNEEFTRSCETTGDPNWQKIQHIPNKTIRRG